MQADIVLNILFCSLSMSFFPPTSVCFAVLALFRVHYSDQLNSGLATDGKSRFSGWPFNSTAVPDVRQVRTSALRPSYLCFCVSPSSLFARVHPSRLVLLQPAISFAAPVHMGVPLQSLPKIHPLTFRRGNILFSVKSRLLIRRRSPPDPGGVRTGRTGVIC